MGIRSMIALPILWDDAVIGLLEVFACEPNAFDANDPIVLKRLAGMCSSAVHSAGKPEPASSVQSSPEHPHIPQGSGFAPASVTSVDDEFSIETTADLPLPHFSRSRKI